MLLTTLFTSLALAQSSPLTLEVDAAVTGGSTVTFTIDGVAAGERVWLFAGDIGSYCPANAPVCLDLASPKVVRRLQGTGAPLEITVVVPPNVSADRMQAATTSGASNILDLHVTIIQGPPQLGFSGVLASCPSTSEADLLVEYVGEADQMVATAYLGGVAVASQELELLPGLPGAVFLWAQSDGVPVADCDDLTWVYEASNATEDACIVQGDEEHDLIADGVVPGHCFAW